MKIKNSSSSILISTRTDNRFYYNGQPVSALSEYDDDNEDIDNDLYNGNSMPNEEKWVGDDIY